MLYLNYEMAMVFIFLLLYACFVGYQLKYLYYFIVDDDTLEIRNHFKFWYKKSFLLKDINSVRIDVNLSFSTRKTEPYFLRIFTKPTTHKTFKACSLRKKDWRGIKALLEDKGVKVISTYPAIDVTFSEML